MANLDTRSKRASSVGILLGFSLLAPVAPDATLDQGDRQQIAWSYSGIAAGAAQVVAVPVGVTRTRAQQQRTTGSATERFSRGINVREVGS